MRRRDFMKIIGGAAAGWPIAARAQQDGRVRRVGVLVSAAATEPEYQSYLTEFLQELRQRGWIEGQNLRVDLRWNAGDASLSRLYAGELIGLQPDVILVGSTVNLLAVQQATSTVPIVFVNVADAVTQGFVSNIRQPGNNVTGFSLYEFSLGGRWLHLLKEIAPSVSRVALMFNPDTTPYFKYFVPVFRDAAPLLGIQNVEVPVRTNAQIESALADFSQQPNGGLLLMGDSYTRLNQRLIAGLAGRFRLPSIAPIGFAKEGGLMDYGPHFGLPRHFRQAATYVDRILRGEKPGDLPVQTPTIYKLVLNLKTAKALGLSVPLQLLGLADEVIE